MVEMFSIALLMAAELDFVRMPFSQVSHQRVRVCHKRCTAGSCGSRITVPAFHSDPSLVLRVGMECIAGMITVASISWMPTPFI